MNVTLVKQIEMYALHNNGKKKYLKSNSRWTIKHIEKTITEKEISKQNFSLGLTVFRVDGSHFLQTLIRFIIKILL